MRRAMVTFATAALMAAVLATFAAAEPQVVNRINGIGLVDYSRHPDFRVGDWARYRMLGQSELGMHDDYEITVLIAGEEEWWGEPCFWVETWTDAAGRPHETAATLMSYSIFNDSLAVQHMQLYMRKSITDINDDGTPKIDLTRSAASALKSRNLFKRPIMWSVDTLGADTVLTPKGLMHARKVVTRQGTGATSSMGDSSMYTEVRENRTTYLSNEVPITHVAREEVENIIARRMWMIGRSAESAPLNIRERGLGNARLVDFGHGLKSRMLPESMQITLAESRRRNAGTTAAATTTTHPRRKR